MYLVDNLQSYNTKFVMIAMKQLRLVELEQDDVIDRVRRSPSNPLVCRLLTYPYDQRRITA